jgi:HEPN domain-containing protein
MNLQERYERGGRLFEDAIFIKDEIIPRAYAVRRWNVVVFEAYRVAELFTKSLFFYAGYEPKESHELDKLIDKLCNLLDKTNWSVPFIYSLIGKKGNCYGVSFLNNRIEFLKRVANRYTVLGSAPLPSLAIDDILSLQIDVNHFCWTVRKGNEVILSGMDASLSEPFQLKRTLVKPSHNVIVPIIKSFLTELRDTREESFYSERPFSEQDADQAIARMTRIFDLSKAFFVEERQSSSA